MDLSTLHRGSGARQQRKRVGRGPGSGTGKTAGRGHKGQKSRSGYSRKPGFEGGQMPLNRRLPKRGFHHEARHLYAVVNLDALARAFADGAEVTPEAVVAAGLVDAAEGGVKILGRGVLSKRLSVTANAISRSARTKIEAAGGTVQVVPLRPQKRGGLAKAGDTPAEER